MAATKQTIATKNPATAAEQNAGEPANITPASEFSPSGAPRQLTEIDPGHPAVDNDPRAGTTVNQNRIDFNDPTIEGDEAVAKALGMKTEPDPVASKDQAKA